MGFINKLFGKAKGPERPAALEVEATAGVVLAPVSGQVEKVEAIPDPVFPQEMMGKTLAIWPSEGTLFCPVSGTLVSAMPHAVGISGDDGIEVLIHVGIDTVEMSGDGFELFVKQGEAVRAGEALMTFDRDKIKAAGKADIIMTIVTNIDDFPEAKVVADGQVSAGDSGIACK